MLYKKRLERILRVMENIREIEDYLGITDNEDMQYKFNVIAEYKNFERIYKNKQIEMCLVEDVGTYIDINDSDIYECGKYIAVYRKGADNER